MFKANQMKMHSVHFAGKIPLGLTFIVAALLFEAYTTHSVSVSVCACALRVGLFEDFTSTFTLEKLFMVYLGNENRKRKTSILSRTHAQSKYRYRKSSQSRQVPKSIGFTVCTNHVHII